jgi:uncharacterized membrane protein
MMLMLVATSAFGATLLLRGPSAAPSSALAVATLGCDALGALTLALGGFYGGELVYRHGVGRTEAS